MLSRRMKAIVNQFQSMAKVSDLVIVSLRPVLP